MITTKNYVTEFLSHMVYIELHIDKELLAILLIKNVNLLMAS